MIGRYYDCLTFKHYDCLTFAMQVELYELILPPCPSNILIIFSRAATSRIYLTVDFRI